MESGGWEAPDTGWGYSLLPNGDLLGGYLGVHGKEKQPKDSKGETPAKKGATDDTLWLFNVAIQNGPFIDGLPIKNGDFPWLC